MQLKSACDSCGQGVSFGLVNVKGRYICSACASNPSGEMRHYCNSCHNYTATALKKGSGLLEFALYFFYIFPGIMYSIWRRAGRDNRCPVCKKVGLIPAGNAKPPKTTPMAPRRDEIECPHCAELILAKASLCKHCGQKVGT